MRARSVPEEYRDLTLVWRPGDVFDMSQGLVLPCAVDL